MTFEGKENKIDDKKSQRSLDKLNNSAEDYNKKLIWVLWIITFVITIILLSGTALYKVKDSENVFSYGKLITSKYHGSWSYSFYDYPIVGLIILLSLVTLNIIMLAFKNKKSIYVDILSVGFSFILFGVAIVMSNIVESMRTQDVSGIYEVRHFQTHNVYVTGMGGFIIILLLFYALFYLYITLKKHGKANWVNLTYK